MTRATYRGVQYDTEMHKEEFLKWWNRFHCDATKWLVYRGEKYRAYDQCQNKN
jgi:hypothetical protein